MKSDLLKQNSKGPQPGLECKRRYQGYERENAWKGTFGDAYKTQGYSNQATSVLLQCSVVENAEIQESKLPHVVSMFPIVVSLNRKICVRLIFCLLLAVSITVASVYFKRRDFFLSLFFILVYITCGASSVKASTTPNILISYN